jgi:hypothetical protein
MLRIGQQNLSKGGLKRNGLGVGVLLLSGAISLLSIVAARAGSQQSVQTTTQSDSATSASSTTSVSSTSPSQIQVQSPQAAVPSQVFPATSREQALPNARRGAGRSDPLAPISGFKPFPSGSEGAAVPTTVVETSTKAAFPQTKFNELGGRTILPPPPPVSVAGQSDLPVSELPLPPDRPSIASKLKLTGVIGDKAVFSITDREAIRINKWPAVVMMAPGDRFESIQTVSVGADSAVLEEDGERSTKTLERIR